MRDLLSNSQATLPRAIGTPIPESATVRVTDRQVACTVSDETVILHLHEGIYYGLNSVGSYVWRAVQAPCELARIVDAVVADFEVSRDRCLSDVRELIEELAKHELVVVSAGQSQ